MYYLDFGGEKELVNEFLGKLFSLKHRLPQSGMVRMIVNNVYQVSKYEAWLIAGT